LEARSLNAALFQVPSDFNILDSELIKQAKRLVEDAENLDRKIKELRKKAEAAQRP
jgi:hypothetical protein